MPPEPPLSYPSASLFRQLAAMVYDSLLIIAILFVAVGASIPFNQGAAINPWLVYLYLVAIIFLFYGWFWSRSGQTLGMRAWKIRLVRDSGGYPDWPTSLLRLTIAFFSFACLGVGYWWRLFKPYTWQDKISRTRVISLSVKSADKPSA